MQELFFLLIYPCLRSWGFILFWSMESERAKDVPSRHLQNSICSMSDKHVALKDLKLISYKKKKNYHTYNSNLLKGTLSFYHFFIKVHVLYLYVQKFTLTTGIQIYVSNELCRCLTLELL